MIGLTRLYKVNGHYVVAESPEDAIRIYQEGEGDKIKDILEVRLLAEGKYPDFAYIDKWAPNEEQMEVLGRAITFLVMHNEEFRRTGRNNGLINDLFNDLKKLM